MSTAGAQGVKFDSSSVRPTKSPITRLIWSCRAVTPQEREFQTIHCSHCGYLSKASRILLSQSNFSQRTSAQIAVWFLLVWDQYELINLVFETQIPHLSYD